jgi:hypothetical protein
MRYQFVDEIVFRHLGRSRLPLLLKVPERTPIARATLMFVCVEPPAGDPARGARA